MRVTCTGMPEDRTAESVSPFDAWTDDNRTIELRVAAMLENLAVVRTVVGAGEEGPVASNQDQDGRERNRRVEAWVLQ